MTTLSAQRDAEWLYADAVHAVAQHLNASIGVAATLAIHCISRAKGTAT